MSNLSAATAGSSVAKQYFFAEFNVISIFFSYMPADCCGKQSPMRVT